VTCRGRLIAERYGENVNAATPLEGWSMGQSLTATLMGILVQQSVYELRQLAPIPEWQSAGDPRAKIRIADILHMSSGLRVIAPQDPDYDPAGPYPDHVYFGLFVKQRSTRRRRARSATAGFAPLRKSTCGRPLSPLRSSRNGERVRVRGNTIRLSACTGFSHFSC